VLAEQEGYKMKDWLGKPLLILAVIFLIAAGVSIYWLKKSSPTAASADQQRFVTKYHIQLEKAIKDLENNR